MAKSLVKIMTLTISVLMVLIYTFSIDLENVFAGDPYARITSSAIAGSPPKLNVTVSFSATPESGATYFIHIVVYQVQPKTGPKGIYEKPISPAVGSVPFSVDLPGKDKGTYRIDVDLKKKNQEYPNGYFLQVGSYSFITYTPEAAEDSGTLLIYSRPEKGARVYINGTYKGDTDLGMKLAPGKVEIKLTKDGYEDFNTSETVVAGKKTEEILVMTPLGVVNKSPTINQDPIPIQISFSADKTQIQAGQSVILSWVVTGSTEVNITGTGIAFGNLQPKDTKTVLPRDGVRVAPLNPGWEPEIHTKYTLTAKQVRGDQVSIDSQTVDIVVEPLSFERIKSLYEAWGSGSCTWGDNSSDDRALVGKSKSGAENNFMDAIYGGEYSRYNCIAMQYKTLFFLNDLKKQGLLTGWEYMPLTGAAFPYLQHNVVGLWKTGKAWQSNETNILDPHGEQKPASYNLGHGDSSVYPWYPDKHFDDIYPAIPGGNAESRGTYAVDNLVTNPDGKKRWSDDTNQKTPWQQPYHPTANPLGYQNIAVDCPVNVLIENSAGQRLGVLTGGKWVSEFNPLDFYFYENEKGDKQWFFALPKDAYKASIEGTGSGTFDVLSYTGGKEMYSYSSNPVATGDRAILSLQPDKVAEFTAVNGQKVTPKSISVELPPPPIKGATQEKDTNKPVSEPKVKHCFIATAAYGSETAEQLNTLRAFRDKVLIQSEPGIWFVQTYYTVSPPLAGFIRDKDALRSLVRFELLDPAVMLLNSTKSLWNN